MRRLGHDASRRVDGVLAAQTDNFVDLARLGGLSPEEDFKGTHLRGIDFAGCALSGFNFQNTVFEACSFKGADTRGADFTGAKYVACALDTAGPRGETEAYSLGSLPLVEWLRADERHPVLIFGGPGSGKSWLIARIIDQLRRQGGTVLDHQALVPSDLWAADVPAFGDGGAPMRTTGGLSFISVDAPTLDSGRMVRLALMEGAGELLLRGNGEHLPEPLTELLKTYRQPISIVYLLPCDANERTLAASDSVVAGALSAYRQTRGDKGLQDQHLLLFRKDALSGAGGAGQYSDAKLLELVGRRDRRIWHELNALGKRGSVSLAAFRGIEAQLASPIARHIPALLSSTDMTFTNDITAWLLRGGRKQRTRRGKINLSLGIAPRPASLAPLRDVLRLVKRPKV